MDSEAWVTSVALFRAYVSWARSVGAEPVDRSTFGRELKRRGFRRKRTPAGCYFWTGLGLRSSSLIASFLRYCLLNSLAKSDEKSSDLYDSFKSFCLNRLIKPPPKRNFGLALRTLGATPYRDSRGCRSWSLPNFDVPHPSNLPAKWTHEKR